MTRKSRRRTAPALRVSVTDANGRHVAGGPAAGLGAWLSKAAPARARGLVSIAIVPDATMRRLNRVHRRVDHATDVLSFPGTISLGDIAIARGVASGQAKAAGHSLRTELRVLAIHGLLHLLGYDHEADTGEMRRVEDRLRRRAGLPAGLIGRTVRSPKPTHR
jgi:probable rRNA maturation factor